MIVFYFNYKLLEFYKLRIMIDISYEYFINIFIKKYLMPKTIILPLFIKINTF
jgi:sensor histidine kinase YesM